VGLIALTRSGSGDVLSGLHGSRSTSGRNWRRAQTGLVAFQVAVALTLLIAAGLLGRSFWNLHNAKIHFEPGNAMTFQVSLPWGDDGYVSYSKSSAYYARLTDRLRALPGVGSVGVTMRFPLGSRGPRDYDDVQNPADAARPVVNAAGNMASPEYFRTMGIPL